MMIYMIMNMMLLMIMVLVSVAFLTLLERKILSYIQMRKGPNKVAFKGLIQPISDAIKLISKEWFFLKVNMIIYKLSPMTMFLLSLSMWTLYPWINLYYMNNSMILFILMLGLNAYPTVMIGWISMNKYALIGSIRSIAQMISFEISLFLMIFTFMMLIESFSLKTFESWNSNNWTIMMMLPTYIMFSASMLIELNRTPFDLIEGESELVSGFNVEYYSSFFVLIFLSEYASIIFMSLIMTMFFFCYSMDSMLFYITVTFHLLMILWLRGVLPRIRYDMLMKMCWTYFLIFTLLYLNYIYLVKEMLANF
uniref:NADH-ubiquinone oxidoreductase chain 1 n=1 Tax=Habropoda radoszkowskii TaxID=597470 RepID=A0A7L8EYN5_9HYME|nr:NADH dehydrogenase subunit 1 [Habropoda radoszkowskii]QOE17517.1 NADH dehydrogenase subunit 1 [Habropoda radoszkowskii]